MTKSVTYKDIVKNNDEIINNSSILKDDDELTIVMSGTSRYYCGTCATSFKNVQKLNEHLHDCDMVWGMRE